MLTSRQEKWCLHFAASGNAADAARNAGYSQKNARHAGSDNLKNAECMDLVANLIEKASGEVVASINDVIHFLSRVMFGTEEGTEMHDRIKAAELMGKRYGLWRNVVEFEGRVPVVIVDDIREDMEGDNDQTY